MADDPELKNKPFDDDDDDDGPVGKPDRREWDLNVQGVNISSPQPQVVARDAIKWAGFEPDAGWIIILKVGGQKEQIDLNTVIDLTRKGIEKIRLTPKKIDNGEATTPRRRDFAMLPKDEAHLVALGIEWDAINENGRRWLILRSYPLPDGYTLPSVDIAIDVPPSYPGAQLDMFFCRPAVVRTSGEPIPQTEHTEIILTLPHQRWSRHRDWNSACDTLATHLTLIDECFLREVEK